MCFYSWRWVNDTFKSGSHTIKEGEEEEEIYALQRKSTWEQKALSESDSVLYALHSSDQIFILLWLGICLKISLFCWAHLYGRAPNLSVATTGSKLWLHVAPKRGRACLYPIPPHPSSTTPFPSLVSLMVSVDVKHHVFFLPSFLSSFLPSLHSCRGCVMSVLLSGISGVVDRFSFTISSLVLLYPILLLFLSCSVSATCLSHHSLPKKYSKTYDQFSVLRLTWVAPVFLEKE